MSQPDISAKQWESFDVTFSKSFVLDQSFWDYCTGKGPFNASSSIWLRFKYESAVLI